MFDGHPVRSWSGVFRILWRGIVALLIALLAILALMLVVLNSDWGRQKVAQRVSRAISRDLAGQIQIQRLGHVGLGGVSGVDARVVDPEGRIVVVADGLVVKVSAFALIREVLKRDVSRRLVLDWVSVEDGRVHLIDDGTGVPSLAAAFAAKQPKLSSKGTATQLSIRRVRLNHVWTHGRLSGMPVDADVTQLVGTLSVDSWVRIEVEDAHVKARGVPRVGSLNVGARLALDIPVGSERGDLRGSTRVVGTASDVEGTLEGKFEGAAVSFELLVPHAEPGAVKRWLPGSDLGAPVKLFASGVGTLPHLAVDVMARLDAATVRATANVDLEQGTGQVVISGRNLAPRALDRDAPAGTLSLDGRATVSLGDPGKAAADFRVGIREARLDGGVLPPIAVTGTFTARDGDAWQVQGEARVREPGANTHVKYRVSKGGKAPRIWVFTSTRIDHPERLSRLLGLPSGVTGTLESEGRITLDPLTLVARVTGKIAHAAFPGGTIHSAGFELNAEGAVTHPSLALDMQWDRLSLYGRHFERGRLRARGTAQRLMVHARARRPDRVDVDATLTLAPHFSVLEPRISVGAKYGRALHVHGGAVRIVDGGVIVRDLAIEDPDGGRATVSMTLAGGLRDFQARATSFDLGKALARVAPDLAVVTGSLNGEARYHAGAKASGALRIRIRDAGYGPVEGGRVEVRAALEDHLFTGRLKARWRDSAVHVSWNEVVPEDGPSAWRDLQGQIALNAKVHLEGLEPVFQIPQVPLNGARGELDVDADFSHREGELRELEASVRTKGLELVGKRDDVSDDATPEQAAHAAPWSVSGTDVALNLRTDELRRILLSAELVDEKGALVKTRILTNLPHDGLSYGFTVSRATLEQVEFDANVWLLPRRISEWPAWARPGRFDATASCSLQLEGTYRDPRLQVQGRLANFRALDSSKNGIDLTFGGRATRRSGDLHTAGYVDSRRVLALQNEWRGDALAYALGRGRVPGFSTTARIDRLPSGVLPVLAERNVDGHLSGRADIGNHNGSTNAELHLTSDDLNVEKLRFERTDLSASLQNERLATNLKISGRELGRLGADIRGHLGPVASGDLSGLRAQVEADGLRLRVLRPLLAGSVSGLDGVLTAHVSGRLSKEHPNLEGEIVVKEGEAQIPELGQMFRDIDAKFTVNGNRVELSKLDARGLTGALSAKGSAELQGLELRSARAKVEIGEHAKVPLTFRGVDYGDAWGTASVEYENENASRQRLDVDVDDFHLDLPNVSPRGVQSLEPDRHVEVGTRVKDGRFVTIPLQPVQRGQTPSSKRTIVSLRIASAEVHKGPGIEVRARGALDVIAGRKTKLDGKIELTGGTLDVSGKEFVIEAGTLSFDHSEVEQGTVVARARWDSPADYTVYAEYNGTVADGELNLRSEPPLSKDEVLSLIMFGTPGGSFGAGTPNDAATAISIAGGKVTQGLNRALSEISQLDVSTRVDTTTGDARPELVLQLTPRVTGRVTQALGEPAPGQSPDRTFFTLDVRLFRRWSLSAQVGDEGGSTLDLNWRLRY